METLDQCNDRNSRSLGFEHSVCSSAHNTHSFSAGRDLSIGTAQHNLCYCQYKSWFSRKLDVKFTLAFTSCISLTTTVYTGELWRHLGIEVALDVELS